jgi:hypothetical protein
MSTDFERYGIAKSNIILRQRSWVFTIDFEAFFPDEIDSWIDAMVVWADIAGRCRWKTWVFIALEDVVRLRTVSAGGYGRFLDAVRKMAAAGATFYPHNHGVFEEKTGLLHAHRPERIDGYPKRASMFFDVVYRHGVDIREWLIVLMSHYDHFLDDAGLQRSKQVAFRAGGWDYGATEADARSFIDGLVAAQVSLDSSASSGVFGTRNWRIGAPYGQNVFSIAPTVVEAGVCWSVDAFDRFREARTSRALLNLLIQPRLLLRRPGAFVTVFHFHNLLRPRTKRDRRSATERIEALFTAQGAIRGLLGMETAAFDDIGFGSA